MPGPTSEDYQFNQSIILFEPLSTPVDEVSTLFFGQPH